MPVEVELIPAHDLGKLFGRDLDMPAVRKRMPFYKGAATVRTKISSAVVEDNRIGIDEYPGPDLSLMVVLDPACHGTTERADMLCFFQDEKIMGITIIGLDRNDRLNILFNKI